ncbi:homeobox domain-containing protein [Syncephalis plumigaleata]|nr:homeobox domain-containing protein [Syncephalis plumigaleata]
MEKQQEHHPSASSTAITPSVVRNDDNTTSSTTNQLTAPLLASSANTTESSLISTHLPTNQYAFLGTPRHITPLPLSSNPTGVGVMPSTIPNSANYAYLMNSPAAYLSTNLGCSSRSSEVNTPATSSIMRFNNVYKRRQRLTSHETARLLALFNSGETHPDQSRREELARELGVPVRSIQIWFQNRRAKAKREQSLLEKERCGHRH